MENGSNYPWVCNTSVLPPTNTSFSQFAIAGTVPSSIILPEIPGWGPFSAASGPPELQIFTGANGTPSLYYSTAASAVGTGGVSATFALPNSVPQGAYALVASNQNADGSYSTNAWDVLTVAGSQTIAGNPFGVAVGGYTDAFEDIGIQNDDGTCPGGTWGQNFYDTIPVVSLYSLGKVLVNGTAVTVGANPTAVTAFTGPDSEQDSSDDCNIYRNKYSGQTSAIVANSGGNTVSILDLVNDAVLNTVTVGRQPVALAVSSDGSKAYVANYADSTVTQVNLTTDTPITTIAVGGQPTSVALTAAGVLWVGGAGFLTEVNTSNMSVAATESTSGRTIAGLGFSDAENELIATSTVGTGSVSIDEISPSSVQNGGTYTALASHSVSTLGTYYNPRIQAQSFGFTSTLTSSSIPINTAQVGAPPLVVQDGWAVVTATPTGFSITDASGHIVLVSETTPSPVAAIAVDTNLNVAYLTEPDSNTLLTVPLPGTGGN
jgi:YVTN family beta-propeller protein